MHRIQKCMQIKFLPLSETITCMSSSDHASASVCMVFVRENERMCVCVCAGNLAGCLNM